MDAAALRREHDEGITAANRKLHDTGALADVTVTVGDVAFPCHKAFLVAWSGYFRSMFSSDFTEKQASHVTLPEWRMVSPEAFSVLHRWMYLGELSLSLDMVEMVLPTAFYLQMDQTVAMLTDYIRDEYSRGVPVSRMFDHLSLAHSCGVPAVRDIALEGMASKFDEVVEMEDFLALKADDLLGLILMDQLHAQSEDIVFSAAFAWLHHSDDRLTYLHDIVKSLRVGLVRAGTIRKALNIQILSINSECCNILLDALAARESDKKSLEQLKKDHSEMFIERTNSPPANTRVRSVPQPDIQELYSDVWRDAYVALGDMCPDFADVTVMVDGEAFHCHKAVLFGWSEYFERRFLHGEGSARLDVSPTDETQDVPRSYEDDLPPGSQGEAPPGVGETGAVSSPSAEAETGPSTPVEEDGVYYDCSDTLPVPEELLCLSPAQAHDKHQDSSGIKHVSLTGGHMTKTAFSFVLDWIYRGDCKVTAENLCDVIMCARCLQMDVVVSLMETYFHKNLSASAGGEIMTVLHSAKTYDIKDVYETCVNQIVAHFEELSGSEEFIRLLDVDRLLRLLQDDRLKVRDENTVFQMALSWLRCSESNLAHTGDVIKSCRLGLVETEILNDGFEVAFSSRDVDVFNVLRQAMNTKPGSLDSLRKDRPVMFRRRTTRNKAFYDSLRETSLVGDTEGAGCLGRPFAACVLGHLVLVADWGSSRLVAFSRPEPAAKHSYVCHVDIDRPLHCVSNKDTDTVYVCSCFVNNITIVKWTQAEGLRVVGKLTAGSKLSLPSHMALDPRDKEHVYVACDDGVHKVSLTTDTVVTTLSSPSGVTCRPWYISSVGSTLMVNYEGDKTFVLYTEGDTSGHVIRPPGLKALFGLGEDGVNFLVGDNVDRCIYVISPSGETLTTVNTGNMAPYYITVDDDTVYFTARLTDGRVHVLQ